MGHVRFDTLSFLSDFGTRDESVGVVKSVVRSIAPEVVVVDVSHDIARHNVRAGALALARAAQYLVPGVVLAVVDPGVGTDRRPIAVEVGDGQSVLVGPDNGLLAPAVALVGGATAAVVLDNPEYRFTAPGATFDGRDLFGPSAAHLCKGVPLTDLGTEIDPASLMPGLLPVGGREGDIVVGEVLWVDHFGNVQLNLDPDDLAGLEGQLMVTTGEGSRTADLVANYAEVLPGSIGLLVDSHGLLSLVVARGSAADELRVAESDRIELAVSADRVGQTTPVELGRTTP